MAFSVTHRVSTVRGWTKLHAGRRVAGQLRTRRNLTPQERANLYVSRMPPAVITASLDGIQPAVTATAGDTSSRAALSGTRPITCPRPRISRGVKPVWLLPFSRLSTPSV